MQRLKNIATSINQLKTSVENELEMIAKQRHAAYTAEDDKAYKIFAKRERRLWRFQSKIVSFECWLQQEENYRQFDTDVERRYP
ncbi:MAG: hypothetical protein J5497_00220 [Selenomonadaceae bacterium]|nr:hypothetical protein [Selenomonadaceae bacterium]